MTLNKNGKSVPKSTINYIGFSDVVGKISTYIRSIEVLECAAFVLLSILFIYTLNSPPEIYTACLY